MAITERRKQFLEILYKLYMERKKPIHYYEIAKKVNVSPATAYDILQLLYKEGYVETVYEETLRKKGRKKVFFKPKEEKNIAEELINIERANPFFLCISFLLFLIRRIKWSEDLKSYFLFILGNVKINIEVILLIIPLLILGYIGKNIYQGINKETIKRNLEEYWKALSNLAEEEKKTLYSLVFSAIRNI